MSFDSPTGAKTPASLPLQLVHIEIMPIVGGKLAVAMQATLLDENKLEFVGEDIARAEVSTLDEMLAVIRQNIAVLAPAA